MIIILHPDTTNQQRETLKKEIEEKESQIFEFRRVQDSILVLTGNTIELSSEKIKQYTFVKQVIDNTKAYSLAGRQYHPLETVVKVGSSKIGGGELAIIAGPCAVESKEQILRIAQDVKMAGSTFLRGGTFKLRSSPYSFQGLGFEGIKLLKIAGERTGQPIVSEIISQTDLQLFADTVDVIQVGARNMQNFDLLREVGKIGKPVLLKRSQSSTIEELLLAAEYILVSGKSQVILCERGIRTFETATRNTLDLSAIPVLKANSHLPVVVDPSHGTGDWRLVEPMALSAVAAGADGLMIEVHNCPKLALSDGYQSVTPELFKRIVQRAKRIHEVLQENDMFVN
jgi:3-deoxy-7-phosphoheptulonate synthase